MNALLQETSSWTDTVDLALCLFIYEVCNDYQFDFLVLITSFDNH